MKAPQEQQKSQEQTLPAEGQITPETPTTQPKENVKPAQPDPAPRMKGFRVRSDLSSLKNPSEYLTLIEFTALPRTMRKEVIGAETQRDLATMLQLTEQTLSEWKLKAGFWEDVVEYRRMWFRDRTADVLLALETKNLQSDKVSGADVKVLLNYTGEYAEHHDITSQGKRVGLVATTREEEERVENLFAAAAKVEPEKPAAAPDPLPAQTEPVTPYEREPNTHPAGDHQGETPTAETGK